MPARLQRFKKPDVQTDRPSPGHKIAERRAASSRRLRIEKTPGLFAGRIFWSRQNMGARMGHRPFFLEHAIRDPKGASKPLERR